MKDTNVAPGLQAAQQSLLREKLSDDLEKKIEKRPAKDDLVEHNILKGGSVAPNLMAAQIALEKSQLHDDLEKKIGERPDKDVLVEKKIIQ